MKVYVFFFYVMSSFAVAGMVSDLEDPNPANIVASVLFGALWPVYLPAVIVQTSNSINQCKAAAG